MRTSIVFAVLAALVAVALAAPHWPPPPQLPPPPAQQPPLPLPPQQQQLPPPPPPHHPPPPPHHPPPPPHHPPPPPHHPPPPPHHPPPPPHHPPPPPHHPPPPPAEHPAEHPVAGHRPVPVVLWGWSPGHFLSHLSLQVRRAWSAGAHWLRGLLHWSHRLPLPLPLHEAVHVHHLTLPCGRVGVVRIISFRALHPHRGPLLWDGKRLAWQHQQHADGTLLTLDHNGVHHAVRLDALAGYLRGVPAGSKVRAEVLGSAWRDLRIVLHVVDEHGKEDASKSVSILVSELIEKLWSHGHEKSSQSHEKSIPDKESDGHNQLGHEPSSSEESREHDRSNNHLADALENHQSEERHSSSSTGKSKGKSKKSSNRLEWDGQSLSWKGVVGADGKRKKVHRRLRITQDGVSHVIPLSVVARHLGDVAPGSDIYLEVVGKKLDNLQIVLHVHGPRGQGADRTVTLKATDLIREMDAKRASVLPGPKTKHGKSIPLLGYTTTTTPSWRR